MCWNLNEYAGISVGASSPSAVERMWFRSIREQYAPSLRQADQQLCTWGEDLELCSLDVLWYPCTWDTVSTDELLLLLPSLACGERSARLHARPAMHLYDALCAKLFFISVQFFDGEGTVQRTIETSVPAHEAVARVLTASLAAPADLHTKIRRGRAIRDDWFCKKPFSLTSIDRFPLPAKRDAHALLTLELLGIRALAALLIAAHEPLASSVSSRNDRSLNFGTDGLWQVVLGAFHSGFNPAYLYPHLVLYHQLFTVAGWIGWLHRGRRAVLPPFIAEYVVDLLQARGTSSAPDLASDVLIYYIDQAIGSKALLRAAYRVLVDRRPVTIRPRRASWRTSAVQVAGLLSELANFQSSGGNVGVARNGRESADASDEFLGAYR